MQHLRVMGTMIMLTVALLFFTSGRAQAITNGRPDGDDHPYVGLAIFKDVNGQTLWRCSGTLLSPTLYLTAGHCTEPPAATATIWFEQDVDATGDNYPFGGTNSYSGTAYLHPLYNPAAFLLYDLGVVVMDTPVVMSEYGELPPVGLLDPLATKRGKQNTTFTAVGYGLQRINPVFVQGFRVRLQATLKLVDLRGTVGVPDGTSVMLSGNAKTGGTCFGDSGGPLFLNDTNIVAAVTSFGLNGNCAGIGGGYRVDTPDDLDWLYGSFGSHLPAPSLSAAAVEMPATQYTLFLPNLSYE